MPSYVVHCALGCASLLVHVTHEPLRQLDSVVVAAISDQAIGPLLTDHNFSLLYFSRSAYNQAIAGLSDSDKEAALRKRLQEWSPRAIDRSMAWIETLERRSLTLTALAAQGRTSRGAAAHFERGLDLLAFMQRHGGYDDMEFRDLLITAVEQDALLIAELGNTEEAHNRTRFAQALALELRKYGEPEFSKALPYAEPSRAVWLAPTDKGVTGYFYARGQPAIPWRGGVVTGLPLHSIRDFQQQGKTVQILYFTGQFLEDAAGTVPQMNRDFEAAASASDVARAQQEADYLNGLRLQLAVLRRVIRERARREDARLIAVLDDQIRSETVILSSQAAKAGSWIFPSDRDGDPLARLREAEQNLRLEAGVFSAFARARDNGFVAEWMREVVSWKTADVENLVKIRP